MHNKVQDKVPDKVQTSVALGFLSGRQKMLFAYNEI